MNRIAMTILMVEFILIGLAIPVAIGVSDVEVSVAVAVGIGLGLLCLLAAGMLRRGRVGYVLGSVLQVVMFGLGFVIPVMFVLGGIFGLLWFLMFQLGREIEHQQLRRGEPGQPH